ncbi:helix-turn-helix transcriptional regulator [Longimycelium tulufanense]|uniref:Helix-turn-helix transcriptional regulator n=1 Tax=Longimycelium tulufanense TaxID=907463 RepID=A0A8J3CA39_9PSEU|nr:LuxR C-terminal-related transcriptional regulator [Longimycelium tulufanense]GGM63277.1 helix-turn-helix transcriptional regulator [Longimycelium tulufanense]
MSPAPTRPAPILTGPVNDLLAAIGDDPAAPLRGALLAPAGLGKTTILREIADTYRRVGAEVLDQAALATGAPAADAVLLVDDAHLLGAAHLRDLVRLAAAPGARLVVAARPWPRPATLVELTEVLVGAGRSLALRPFDPAQVADLLAGVLGRVPSPALVEFVHAQTGGVPRFVARLAAAFEVVPANPDRPTEVPLAALTGFQPELDWLDPDVQRLLLAIEAGFGRHLDLLAALLDSDAEGVAEVMAAARATSLVDPDGALPPLSRRAIAAVVPAERRYAVRQRLAELRLGRGGPVLPLARSLLGTGAGGASAAAVFEAAAGEALVEQPALAGELFAAAVAAGRPADVVAAGRARAAALVGDFEAALRWADQVIATEDAPGRRDAAAVAAAAFAHRGQLDRSAELYRWAGVGPSPAFAAIGLLGTGRLEEARQLLAEIPVDGPPTLLVGAAALMAHGLRESVDGCWSRALSTLVRAASLLEPARHATPLPDSPAALAALVALHCGEFDAARSVLDRALATGMGGTPMAVRHRLLLGWIAMARGRTAAAREHLTRATPGGTALEPRDRLFAVALEVGLARRHSDLAGLHRHWGHAREAVLRHPVDLYTFLPLAELATAAARQRDSERIAPHLAEARSVLARLGDPSLWAAPLHWGGLHAAIIADRPEAAEQHAVALAEHRDHNRHNAVLAAAGECWLEITRGRVDPARVDAVALALHDAGLVWDAARLAGQAAIRTSDRRAMVGLLDRARMLQGTPRGATPGAAAGTTDARESVQLSEREQEVAALVLAGMTYRQVADRLFISAKTVEHHMARMRQRLGCANRSELLARLRQLVDARPGTAPGSQ